MKKERTTKRIMNKKLSILLICITLILAGCTVKEANITEGERTFEDSLGNNVTIEKTPEKVISLSPAITEMLYALELENKIAGTTDYCDYPEAAKHTPKMGGFNTPNLELIVEAEPDLVFISSGVQAELSENFKKLGIKTFALDATTINEVISNIELIGVIMNAEEKAQEITDDMIVRKEFIKEKAENLEKPLVFFEIWNEPLLSAGPNTFIADILNISGGINFAQDSNTDYPQVSLELLIERDPDFYIAIDHKKNTDISERPGFDELKAIKNNQYHRIPDDYVTLPGPRIIEGLEKVASIIHPEIFE
jgi:iron complex transport system substrate-binding protein